MLDMVSCDSAWIQTDCVAEDGSELLIIMLLFVRRTYCAGIRPSAPVCVPGSIN